VVMLHPSQPTPMPREARVLCCECAEGVPASSTEELAQRRFICEICMPHFTCRNCGSVEIHHNMRTWKLCNDCATTPRVLLAWVRQLIGREW